MNTVEVVYSDHKFSLETKEFENVVDTYETGYSAAWTYFLTSLCGASGKEPACQCRRHKRRGFDPWVGKSPGDGNGNPLQYPCLENLMDRAAW